MHLTHRGPLSLVVAIVVVSAVIRVDAGHFLLHAVGIAQCGLSCRYSIVLGLFFLRSQSLFFLYIEVVGIFKDRYNEA